MRNKQYRIYRQEAMKLLRVLRSTCANTNRTHVRIPRAREPCAHVCGPDFYPVPSHNDTTTHRHTSTHIVTVRANYFYSERQRRRATTCDDATRAWQARIDIPGTSSKSIHHTTYTHTHSHTHNVHQALGALVFVFGPLLYFYLFFSVTCWASGRLQ